GLAGDRRGRHTRGIFGPPRGGRAMSAPRARASSDGVARTSRAGTVVCLVVAAGLWIRLGPAYAEKLRPGTDPTPDFFQDWASARNHRGGLPVYSPQATTIPLYLGRPQTE